MLKLSNLRSLQTVLLPTAIAVLTLTAYAADPNKLENLRVTNACKYCDLTDAALAGADLRGADFQNANLSGANLSKADLSQRPLEKRTPSTNFWVSHTQG